MDGLSNSTDETGPAGMVCYSAGRDGNGLCFHWILREWDGNGTSGKGRDGTGFHFHSCVPL